MTEPAVRAFDDTDQSERRSFDDALMQPPTTAERQELSPLAQMAQVVQGEVVLPNVTLDVPARPGVGVIYDPNIDSDILGTWRKRATQPQKQGGGVDPLKLGLMILTAQCRGFTMNGVEVTVDGEPMDFNTPRVREMVGLAAATSSGPNVARAFYGVDAHCIMTAEEVLSEAGYGDSIANLSENPTQRH